MIPPLVLSTKEIGPKGQRTSGGVIGIAASASPFDKQLFLRGVQVLKRLGFKVYFRKDIFSKEGYLAGSDKRRAAELTELIRRKDVKAILFARGGYGSQRLIPHLDLVRLKKYKKPLVGFSDLTALLNFLNQKGGFPTLYGPVLTQLGRKPLKRTIASLKWHLTQKKPHPPVSLKGCKILKQGKAVGKLAGGCLSLIVSSLGTPYALDTKNKILFFEDNTNEKVYTLDRMLTQLKNAGCLKSVKAILIGTLHSKEANVQATVAMLKDVLKDFKGPIVFGFPAGHTDDFVSLPMGIEVTLDTRRKKLEFKKPWVQ